MVSTIYLFVNFCSLQKVLNTSYIIFVNNENSTNKVLFLSHYFVMSQKFPMNIRSCLEMQNLVCNQTVLIIYSLIISDTYPEEYFTFLQVFILFLNIKQRIRRTKFRQNLAHWGCRSPFLSNIYFLCIQ